MARSRNIKPALFKNELLGEADPLLTILFIGLWCLADREGRLEDRPKRIKAEIFPYRENLDVNGYLTVIERLGFIRRYSVGDLPIIQVLKFAEHQNPHHTEKPSVIPVFSTDCELTVKQPLNNGYTPADSGFLIPDSGFRIPEKNTEAAEAATQQPPVITNPEKQKNDLPRKLTREYELTSELREYAENLIPKSAVDAEFAEFKDFWIDIATKNNKRTLKGWGLTWQKRIRDIANNPQKRSEPSTQTQHAKVTYEPLKYRPNAVVEIVD